MSGRRSSSRLYSGRRPSTAPLRPPRRRPARRRGRALRPPGGRRDVPRRLRRRRAGLGGRARGCRGGARVVDELARRVPYFLTEGVALGATKERWVEALDATSPRRARQLRGPARPPHARARAHGNLNRRFRFPLERMVAVCARGPSVLGRRAAPRMEAGHGARRAERLNQAVGASAKRATVGRMSASGRRLRAPCRGARGAAERRRPDELAAG